MPPPADVVSFYQTAQKYPAQLVEQEASVTNAMRASSAIAASVAQNGGNAQTGGQAAVDQAKELARTNPSIAAYNYAGAVQKQVEANTTAMNKDPLEYASRPGVGRAKIGTLNFNDPSQMVGELVNRANQAPAISALTGGPVSLIRPGELSQVQSVMQSGTIESKLAILGGIGIGNPDDASRKATFAAMAMTGDGATQIAAVAGSMMNVPGGVALAKQLLLGQQQLAAEPKLAPKTADRAEAMEKHLPVQDFPDPKVREIANAAVPAYYAALSAKAGDTTGVMNEERWKTAVDAVTGGVIDYRGTKVFAPQYGMPEASFRDVLRNLSDADFADARTSGGGNFPAAWVKPSISGVVGSVFRLQSHGQDGHYIVISGDMSHPEILHDKSGNAFDLDLSRKQPPPGSVRPQVSPHQRGDGGLFSNGFSADSDFTPPRNDAGQGFSFDGKFKGQ